MKKLIFDFTFSIRLIIAACVVLVSSYNTNAQSTKILPLGNSITQSNSGHLSYRYPLWTKLIDDGVSFDFIGSMSSNYGGNPDWPSYAGQSFDQDHEGHWGWRVDQINASLPGWMTSYTADIVLIHLGTNDMAQNNSISSTVNEIKDLIDLLRVDNPNVKILLATLIPSDDLLWSWAYRIPLLNAEIPSIVAEKSTNDSPIYLVDQYTGFNPVTDTFDGVHPNESGEEKMAQKWKDGIDSLMSSLKLNLNIFLEGPFKNGKMDTTIIDLIPISQPFLQTPWEYDGTELISENVTGIVDWVLVELRDASTASNADAAAMISRMAALLLYDGRIVNTDGNPDLEFFSSFSDGLFVAVWHRNHLPVLSSIPLSESAGIYSYDFSLAAGNVHLSAQKELESEIFGMIAGDINNDGIINITDLSDLWSSEVGNTGYLNSDVNFNIQADNTDKNEIIINNFGLNSGLPDYQ